MKMSKQGLAFLAGIEGIVKKPYKDSVGVWTIGIGHTKNAGSPNPERLDPSKELSIPEIMALFAKDIKKYEDRVNRAVTIPLEQHQFDALVSFDYNTGGIHKASLVKSLNNRAYGKAADQFMNWVKPKEVTGRRMKEKYLFRDGVYGSGKAVIYDTNNRGKVLWGSGKRVDVLEMLGVETKIPVEAPQEPVQRVSKPKPSTPTRKEAPSVLGAILGFFWDLLKGKTY